MLDDYTTATDVIEKYSHYPDMLFELRLDLDPRLIALLDQNKEFIVTIRSKEEGGKSELPLAERHRQLQQIAQLNPPYIDLEYARDREILQIVQELTNGKVVLSLHDYSASMETTSKKYLSALQGICISETLIIKYVGSPVDALDAIHGINNLMSFPQHVVLGISTAGEISRTLSPYFQQQFVFGSLSQNFLLHIDDLLSLREHSIVAGLLGKSLAHSFSPQLHRLLRESVHVGGYYHLFEFTNKQRVLEFLAAAKELPMQGMNVTFPYKQIVLQAADTVTDAATILQAANTLSFNGKITAMNTDVTGFQRVLQELQINADTAVILGAGGAARAVALACLNEGIAPTIVFRSRERLQEFNKELREQINFAHISQTAMIGDIFINATPLGLKGELVTDSFPLPKQVRAVIDLVYGITGTPLTQHCTAAQCIDGKHMLFHQAVDAFEIWTNKKVDRKKVLQNFLQMQK